MSGKITKAKGGFKPRSRLQNIHPQHFEEKIIKTLWEMKKDHLAESTIKVTNHRLRLIAKTVNLNDPDKVTEYLANKEGKSGYIDSLTSTYER